MICTRHDVFEADCEIVDEDRRFTRLGGNDHLGFAPPENTLDLSPVREFDSHEGVDSRRTESIDSNRPTDQAPIAAIDRPADEDGHSLFFESRLAEGWAAARDDRFDVASRHAE